LLLAILTIVKPKRQQLGYWKLWMVWYDENGKFWNFDEV